jgi:hypothetical protein
LLLFNIKAYALENVYQEEKLIGDNVETEIRYKWYKDVRLDGDYYLEESNSINYPYIDYNDNKTIESDWSFDKPIDIKNRTIEQRSMYKYKEIKPIRYINFFEMAGSSWNLKISELNIYIDNQKIDYFINCTKCSNNYEQYINDNNIYQDNVYVYNWYEIYIDLKGYYDPSKIKIELYVYDQILSYKTFSIVANNNGTTGMINQQYYYQKIYDEFFCNNIYEIKKYTLLLNENNVYNPEWTDYKYSLDYQTNSYSQKVEPVNQYRYIDRIYKYYKIDRQYFDDNYYKASPSEEYIQDENDYKIYYRYIDKNNANQNATSTNIDENISNNNVDNSISENTNNDQESKETLIDDVGPNEDESINNNSNIEEDIDSNQSNEESIVIIDDVKQQNNEIQVTEKNENILQSTDNKNKELNYLNSKENINKEIVKSSALAIGDKNVNNLTKNKYIYLLISVILISFIPLLLKLKK